MDINEAKRLVIEAGNRLVANGLIARTWGNVSCRISSEEFVITPSGKAYDSLTPDDIVVVSIEDLSYEGEVKPSSEKGVHAAAYKLRPQCNFVIHTHQPNASAISALGCDINGLSGRARELIGSCVPVAAYGLPGTGKLRAGVSSAIKNSESKAIIMKHHGAVCLGADYEDAFAVAAELEVVCMKYICERYRYITGNVTDSFVSIANYVKDTAKKCKQKDMPTFPKYDSERFGDTFNLYAHDSDECIVVNVKDGSAATGKDFVYTPSMDLHAAIYRSRSDVNSILHSENELINATSAHGITIRPLVDDFAQLVGISLKTVEFDPNNTLKTAKRTVKKLKHRNAVMLKDNGAVCVAGERDDAEAVEMVLEKGIKTYMANALFSKKGNTISPVDSVLMRLVYKMKYSKQK